MRVIVAVCTLGRLAELAELLPRLSAQATPSVPVSLLVVDNDPAGSAAGLAAEHGAEYAVERRQGVGHARNRALELAAAHEYDALVFFDDDQLPSAGWLAAFVAAHREDPEAIWVGQVDPLLDFDLPAWAPNGWPWCRAPHPHGLVLAVAGDGNVLIPSRVARSPECRYADAFLNTMGQDTELFTRLRRRGVARLRAAPAAAASERVPLPRRRPEWILTRHERASHAWARVQTQQGGIRPVLRIALAYVKSLVVGAAFAVVGKVARRPDMEVRSRCLWGNCRGYRQLLVDRCGARPTSEAPG